MIAHELYCPDGERLQKLRAQFLPVANAIDHVAVLPSKRALAVVCLKDVGPLTAGNVVLEGGERVTVRVLSAFLGSAAAAQQNLAVTDKSDLQTSGWATARVLVVTTDSSGDFSTYTLRLVTAPGSDEPASGFDPLLHQASFSFKVSCPSAFDCREERRCAEPTPDAPRIDYLTRDYASSAGSCSTG